jgi:hypothetical protein
VAAAGPISFKRPAAAATGGYLNEASWRLMCCQEHMQDRRAGGLGILTCRSTQYYFVRYITM